MTNFPFKAQLVEAQQLTKGTEFDVLKCVRINYLAATYMELIVVLIEQKTKGFYYEKIALYRMDFKLQKNIFI